MSKVCFAHGLHWSCKNWTFSTDVVLVAIVLINDFRLGCSLLACCTQLFDHTHDYCWLLIVFTNTIP